MSGAAGPLLCSALRGAAVVAAQVAAASVGAAASLPQIWGALNLEMLSRESMLRPRKPAAIGKQGLLLCRVRVRAVAWRVPWRLAACRCRRARPARARRPPRARPPCHPVAWSHAARQASRGETERGAREERNAERERALWGGTGISRAFLQLNFAHFGMRVSLGVSEK